ncbi:DUF3987 domain-containing protein [Asaia siamensis]|uniref:DUF3987 domain-containing protein n=1 Tax=Asaia siamensis TaxID=110479 RepID=A0ABQ1MKA9_9PROT|nr:DUF3987 domain-containing protein [Asaia siamensis]GBR07121.1 hypothetical protein AA0323_1679 [Asaia siamensis NRIC 0323]GGC42025.1 hypothetical protein GCM10007207_29190 [Asaia siamensis]
MPRKQGRKAKAKQLPKPQQISIFDTIGYSTLSDTHKDTLRGFLALKPGGTQWRGRDIIPPDTFLATVVDRFEQGCDVPLEIPALTALHGIGAWLLDQNVTIDILGSVSRPDLWTTILADSGASKTYATRVLQRVMALRRFPEVTTAAQFVADLQEHNRAAWFQDEWGQLIKRINSQTYADEIRDYLLRLYDNATITRRTRSQTIQVKDAALVILGTTVTDTFLQNVTLESMLDGFMQRFQYVIAERRPGEPMPLYSMDDAPNIAALAAAWDKLQETTIHSRYTASPEAVETYTGQFRRLFRDHHEVPTSFFRRILWRSFKYALVYHVLLGKETAEIDAADMGWAVRVAELHLQDARRLLDRYNMSDLEKIVVKAESLAKRLGHQPTSRDLINGVRDIKNAQTARFVLELMRPQAGRGAQATPPPIAA